MGAGALTGGGTAQLRRHNARTVLDLLLDSGSDLAGTDIMAATGLSRPTVHAVCDALIDAGWLVERPPDTRAPAQPGRPARVYAARADAANVLGVDLGATSVRAAVADLRGTVRGEAAATFRHDRVPADERLAVTRATAARARTLAGDPELRAAAIGVPSPVVDGRARSADDHLPGLAALDLRRALDPLPVAGPVVVDNDANLALLAERWSGAAAGVDDAVQVLTGERFGAGLCLDGRLVRGHRGAAGELGFLHLVAGVGDTDAIGSLARRWGSHALGRPVRAEEVVAAARDGDARVSGVLHDVARRTARALAIVATLLDPEVIVLGGGAAGGADVLLAPLQRELAALIDRPPRLVASRHTDRGVLLGAVRTALDDLRPRLLIRKSSGTGEEERRLSGAALRSRDGRADGQATGSRVTL